MSHSSPDTICAETPSSNVTLLFTDVAGSTKGWETHGDLYAAALERHFGIISGAVSAAGGTVFKTVGDQVCAAFPSTIAAVLGAMAAQQCLEQEAWPAPVGPLRVRMAVHAGYPQCRDGDYFGPPVNRVARLLNAAHPGQILLSAAAHTALPVRDSRFTVKSLGVHMLKDLLNPEAIFQVAHPGLETSFPPPRTLDARPHNLPAQLTSFVGRSTEIHDLAQRLDDPGTRMVTLMGPPGVGKTRLAMQFAAEYAFRYPDGVWLIELAALRDPTAVSHQIEIALGIAQEGASHTADRLHAALANRELLLVFDNFEHLLPASGSLSALLQATQRVKVLVTSRALLRVSGETVMEVPPLETPMSGDRIELPDAASYPSTALFVERAAAARPLWAPSALELRDIAVICRELDGLPLAIELAAARFRSMSISEIRSRLSDRFRLLSSGSVDLPERQRTLRAALDWSFDLLTPSERTTLTELSVFRGGFTMEAAETVCPESDVWEVIPSLHDQSFLVARERHGAMRYDMLEVIREYAAARHEAATNSQTLHSVFFLSLAEDAARALDTAGDAAACKRLETDVENIRAALTWSCSTGDAGTCARLSVSTAEFFNRRGWWTERLKRLEDALNLSRSACENAPSTAWLLYHYSNALADVGRLREAKDTSSEALGRARRLSDTRLEAWTLILQGFLAERENETAAAEELYRAATDVAAAAGDQFSHASALTNQARLADFGGHTDRAVDLLQHSLLLWRNVGSARGVATALTNLGCIADEVEGNRAEDDGNYALAHERREEAIRLFVEALGLQLELQNAPKIALLLNNIGEALERDGRPNPAVRLYEAAERLFLQAGSPKAAYVIQQLERARKLVGTAPTAGADPVDPMEIARRTATYGPNAVS